MKPLVGIALLGLAFPLLGAHPLLFNVPPPTVSSICVDIPNEYWVADINGDGHADLIAADRNWNLQWVAAAADGSFAKQCKPLLSEPLRVLLLRDLDGDGKVDILGNASDGTIFFHGNGDGTFGARQPLGINATHAVAADVNGDGRIDLLLATDSSQLKLVAGSATGFTPPVLVASSFDSEDPFWVADGDGDGKLDVFSFGSNITLDMLRGHGDGTFAASIVVADHIDATFVIGIADVDGDGLADLVTRSGVSNPKGNILTQKGSPTGFLPAVASQNPIAILQLIDLDGDGRPELVGYKAGAVFVSRAQSDGTFSRARVFAANAPVTNSAPEAFLVGDFNGDGKLDAMIIQGANARMLPGNGDGTFRAAEGMLLTDSAGNGLAARGAVVADFNGDGFADVAVMASGSYGSSLFVFANDGHGNLHQVSALPVALGSSLTLTAVDVDGDGKLDIVAADYYTISVFLGDGHGNLRAAPPNTVTAHLAGIGKLGANGPLGVVLQDSASTAYVATLTADGRLRTTTRLPYGIATAEVSRDGVISALLTTPTFVRESAPPGLSLTETFLLTMTGPATYTVQQVRNVGTGKFIDLDGDGHPDLLGFSGSPWYSFEVFRNRGDETFEFKQRTAIPAYGSVITGDFNGDGKTDIALDQLVLINRGDDTFDGGGMLPLPVLAAGDLDGDGRSDLIAADNDYIVPLLSHEVPPGNGSSALIVNSLGAGQYDTGTLVSFSIVTPTPPSGSITFTSGNDVIGIVTNALATAARLPMPAGTPQITAEYSGDAHFGPASATAPFTVAKAQFQVEAIQGGSWVGSPVPYWLTIAPSAAADDPTLSGNVHIHIDGADYAAPAAVVNAFSLPITAGLHNVTINYDGDANHAIAAYPSASRMFRDTPLDFGKTVINVTNIGNNTYHLAPTFYDTSGAAVNNIPLGFWSFRSTDPSYSASGYFAVAPIYDTQLHAGEGMTVTLSVNGTEVAQVYFGDTSAHHKRPGGK